jgi:pimeloyl-ACP methyl ester carboxylesterase
MATVTPQPPIWRESRLPLELAALVRDPVFRGRGVTDGGGQPVLLVPGFLAGDDSLSMMARWLKGTGHRPSRARIRANVDCSSATVERLEDRLESLVDKHGQRAAIIGHSRGGAFAKVLARRRPDLVSGVVALGSPQVTPLGVNRFTLAAVLTVGALGTLRVPGFFSHKCLVGDCCETFWEQHEQPLPRGVGYVSVYSRTDGIVDWRSCLDPSADHVEVESSHCGMAVHPDVYRVIADSLRTFRRRDSRRKPVEVGATVTPIRHAA